MVISRTLANLIRIYQNHFSPYWPSRCRFYPTCSEFATQAIQRHGAGRGLLMAIWRVLRCHPFNPGGYDPVPEEELG